MEFIFGAMEFLRSHPGESVLGGLLLISEGLASIQKVQANSIFQLVVNGLKRLKEM